jgi:hypothetical protein
MRNGLVRAAAAIKQPSQMASTKLRLSTSGSSIVASRLSAEAVTQKKTFVPPSRRQTPRRLDLSFQKHDRSTSWVPSPLSPPVHCEEPESLCDGWCPMKPGSELSDKAHVVREFPTYLSKIMIEQSLGISVCLC